jgi:UPF0271 protein
MRVVDLNCDLGEGAGPDAELMPFITSANIACGGHAGDDETMRTTITLALKFGVAIGAHPGFPDRESFGRREISADGAEIHAWVIAQTRRLIAIATTCGATVRHVKPHGALYNLAARDGRVARAIACAVSEIDPQLILVGLSGSCLIDAGVAIGLETLSEAFADRAYRADGTLMPRTQLGALIEDEAVAVAQAVRLAKEGKVTAVDGRDVEVKAETLCLHGDGAHALSFARAVNEALRASGVSIRA